MDFGIGQHDDHLVRELHREMRLRWFAANMNFVRPLLGANRIAVQRVDDGIAALHIFLIAGRQKDEDIAIHCIPLQIAFKGCAVDLDVLHRVRLCAWDDVGNDGLRLRGNSGYRRPEK